MSLHALLLFLHLAGVVLWVGGMAFAWLCLRPAALQLPPPQRLSLWAAVFSRFFPLAGVSVLLIAASGLGMLLAVGFAAAPPAWHVMLLSGTLMFGVFASILLGPWPRLRAAVADQQWAAGGEALALIRRRVGFNLALGGFTIAVAALGRGW